MTGRVGPVEALATVAIVAAMFVIAAAVELLLERYDVRRARRRHPSRGSR